MKPTSLQPIHNATRNAVPSAVHELGLTCVLILSSCLCFTGTSYALPKGVVTTLFNGPLPPDAHFFVTKAVPVA